MYSRSATLVTSRVVPSSGDSPADSASYGPAGARPGPALGARHGLCVPHLELLIGSLVNCQPEHKRLPLTFPHDVHRDDGVVAVTGSLADGEISFHEGQAGPDPLADSRPQPAEARTKELVLGIAPWTAFDLGASAAPPRGLSMNAYAFRRLRSSWKWSSVLPSRTVRSRCSQAAISSSLGLASSILLHRLNSLSIAACR